MTTYDQLVQQTKTLCHSIADYPEKRLQVRKAFYQTFGFKDKDGLSFGDSEIAFLEWEIKRGVLNPLNDAQQPGSNWWRNVNLKFIFHSELAGAMHQAKVTNPDAPIPVLAWLDFIQSPSPENWYKAHNTTILAGFNEYIADGVAENNIEQIFLNITLYRLMFAQALVEDATIFGDIGEWSADPRYFSVKLITSLPDFYPTHYPLTEADLDVIEGKKHTIEDKLVYVMDHDIILPHIQKLYAEAAKWDQAPWLPTYLNNKEPVYPFPSNS